MFRASYVWLISDNRFSLSLCKDSCLKVPIDILIYILKNVDRFLSTSVLNLPPPIKERNSTLI